MANAGTRQLRYLIQQQADLPAEGHWLTPPEAVIVGGFHIPKRRQDWLLGRWTAKTALTRLPAFASTFIGNWQIEADGDGAPTIVLDGRKVDIPISLSHSHGLALCLLAEPPMRIGCDLELIEPRSRAFEETWFTSSELALLDQSPPAERACLVTFIWSAKESALKLLRTGLAADTRHVCVHFTPGEQSATWRAFDVEDVRSRDVFHGWWRKQQGMVITVVADAPVDPPVSL